MSNHAWCRDIHRDEAVRAAEDGRAGPLPTLEECIETARAMMPKSVSGSSAPEQENKGNGMRTERVTMEITWIPPSGQERIKSWLPSAVLERWFGAPGESVRVVDEVAFDAAWADRLTAERDASKKECERLRDVVRQLSVRSSAARSESAANAAPAANAGGVSNPEQISDDGKPNCQGKLDGSQEPVAWGVAVNGVILATSTSRSDAVDMQSEHVCETVVVPLYAAAPPARGWLTEEEREFLDHHRRECEERAATFSKALAAPWFRRLKLIDALLARSSPPEVVLPPMPDCSPMADYGATWSDCLSAVREALRRAGVKVQQPLPPGPEANG